MLASKGYNLFATGGTHRFLEENGISSTRVYWPSEEDMEPQALTMLHERKIDMVVNIPRDLSAGELNNGYKIRRAAIDLNVPLITNADVYKRQAYPRRNTCEGGDCLPDTRRVTCRLS